MDASPDSELIAALREGQDTAYAQLLHEYGGTMLVIARRYMRNEDDARDCFQEACLKVFKAINKFEQRSSLKTWIHRIVVNECLMKLRKQQRGGTKEVEFDDSAEHFDAYGFRIEPNWDLGDSAENLLQDEQKREFVLAAIDKLSDDFRNILLLRDIQDYNTQETAQLLDVSEAVVKTRLHRARGALKVFLEPLYERRV